MGVVNHSLLELCPACKLTLRFRFLGCRTGDGLPCPFGTFSFAADPAAPVAEVACIFFCLTRAFWMAGPRVPAACQPGLERGVRGVSPRLKKRIEEALLPHSKGGPPLPEGRTPLTRKADPPYPKGGPPLPERRAFLGTRKADPPCPKGGYYLLARRYSLLERRMYSCLLESSRGG